MESKDKLNKLMEVEDLEEEEIKLLEECQLAFDSFDVLSFQEEEQLDKLYSNHFIDYEKSAKENKSLRDY